MIPMTKIAPNRTISPMGRATTPVKFRAEMAKRLSAARVVAGYTTKKEAAVALQIGLDRYEKWESGRTPVPAQYVGPICELFHIDANYLFGVQTSIATRKAV
jgi:transcriptional regulator with XRE-family HTH domain